ncbi:MARTX multifunctional-autoprocessing repeats-in-toxin holotoxin RtxA [Xenorhabdus sp. KK7.4]|uniref:MARTX multifunctional-autoprocessing repeats-in-toxin holotoxin RtxA n=1 Tax=Xenorhabdus sp. KK7.4 TaxID=1851572 RepID=UPI000C053952|nr:MARTX multifunctional-autoprocessing repeats-in-toxin holotoxin RtxA [Xenorhabdus sp. KK7.4]PHM55835.1 Autotransporter adhesin [Xenorhabdus sp. KK7.4]
MGKPFWRSVEYFFTGNYTADDGDNNIVAIGFGGQIHAYGGNDHIALGSIAASVYTGSGNDTVVGGSAYLKISDTSGNLNVTGASGYAEIEKEGEGNIVFSGAAGGAVIQHNGRSGHLNYSGAGAYNSLNRHGENGNITFSGAGGYNHFYSDVTHGNIHFMGAGGYNQITRKGTDDNFGGEGMAYAKAEEMVLMSATLAGNWIQNHQKVTAVKSARETNTHLFALVDGNVTKVNKIHLSNDPQTGRLKYFTTSWFKEGNHLNNLASHDISERNGFQIINLDNAYTLSGLKAEYHQAFTIHAIEKELPENEWVTYADGVQIAAENITLSDARMGGYAISTDGSTVDVKPVKSNRMENTYLYARVLGEYTKVVVVQLKNDPETGKLKYIATPWYKAGDQTAVMADQFIGPNYGYSSLGKGSYTLSHVHYSVNTVRVTSGTIADVSSVREQALFTSDIKKNDSSGDVRFEGAGGGNVIKSNVARGNVYFKGAGLANVILHNSEIGDTEFRGAGAANVIFKKGKKGHLNFNGGGIANVITHISTSHLTSDSSPSDLPKTDDSQSRVIALGGANVLTRKGHGRVFSVMGGGANVLTHLGNGETTGVMMGGANVLTKVGDGDTTGIMLGLGNVLTHVGNGRTLGTMGAVGNVFTKVGDGETIAAMLAVGNIFTHIGDGEVCAMMAGGGNVFTKVGNGNALALMVALGNVFTHVGDGLSVALMVAKGNLATKVGNGESLAAMIGVGNVMTHIGNGNTFAAMVGETNIFTKAGDELTAAVMIGKANIYTHVGQGTSLGLFAGNANIMTKVGDGTTLAAMFGQANVMTHAGSGLTGVLALGEANVVTKVGHEFMGVLAAAKANVITHVGHGVTAGVLLGKGNILTKVGNGTTVGLLVSKFGNIMTHVGDGNTVGFAKGTLNLMTKMGDGLAVNAAWGDANIMTHVGAGDHYNFARGKANLVTKIGDGRAVSVVQGSANILTHLGRGDDYTGAWGKANVITKVGNGRQVTLAKGDANIVTHVGQGDSLNALWSQSNVVTKVGDGMQITAAKGKSNITTSVGNGLSVVAAHGDLNVNTKVGDGISVNVAWGKLNVSTKVGDGLNVSVMKGTGNASVHVGDGMNIHASYARNNVAIQIGNGDFYNLALASSNTESHKLATLFGNIKQTLLGAMGSQGINFLVQGDEANTSGSYRGRGAINLPEINSLKGFELTEIGEVSSTLSTDLHASVSQLKTPDVGRLESIMNGEEQPTKNQKPNLIINGDFEAGTQGWQATNGIEVQHPAASYGLDDAGHGSHVTELDAHANTTIYQDLHQLKAGEVITLDFDFAPRAGSTDDNGIEVLWNGQVVFSSSDDSIAWQHKQLVLIAQAGSNRLAFSGTGRSDGRGYILDNVVACSNRSGSAKVKQTPQTSVAGEVLDDKENAEADSERLMQERDQQLAAIADTQNQLAATDLDALNTNGLAQRDVIRQEDQAITDDLLAKAKALESLDNLPNGHHQGDSGTQWRHDYAGRLLDDLQSQLDKAKNIAEQQLKSSDSSLLQHRNQIDTALEKSEAGIVRSEQNQRNAQQDITDARNRAEFRSQEAQSQKIRAAQAASDGYNTAQQAEQDAAIEAKNSSQKTARRENKGSGLSGPAYEPNGAEHTGSHITQDIAAQGEGRFRLDLPESDDSLVPLADAKQALDRLQIKAGIISRKTNIVPTRQPDEPPRNITLPDEVSREIDASETLRRALPDISVAVTDKLEALGNERLAADYGLPQNRQIPSNSASLSTITARAQKVADIYRWLDSDTERLMDFSADDYIPVPGIARIDVEFYESHRQKMIDYIEGYLNSIKHTIPQAQVSSLAKLFVESTIDYDWDKRVRFMAQLEQYGYHFDPADGEQSVVTLRSGNNSQQYRELLNAAQPNGKKVVYDTDLPGHAFSNTLSERLLDWASHSLDPHDIRQKEQQSAIEASVRSNMGLWSSVYATKARGDVYVIAEGGLLLGSTFWNLELPVLRQLQREGMVGEIRLLDKPAAEYKHLPLKQIGSRLNDNDIGMKVRFDALNPVEQQKYREINADHYQPDTLVDLNVRLGAIDSMLNKALPFYRLRSELNILIREGADNTFEVHSWPENRHSPIKMIKVENPKDPAQLKVIEQFILANYESYDQFPKELHFIENNIVSYDQRRTQILAEKINGRWSYRPSAELMSVDELQQKAYIKGKPMGESYRNVIDALQRYEQALMEDRDYSLDAIEKLTYLCQQVEGYVLGHADSKRTPAMQQLLSQVYGRLSESMTLAEPTLRSSGEGSFSELYNKLSNSKLSDSKHLYIDTQGDFVTQGRFSVKIAKDTAGKGVRLVMEAVTREYGQDVTNAIFSKLKASDLAKDGIGIDISGLKKVHREIERHLSPVSATLYIWKPSDHSSVGHAALQIGHGRVKVSPEEVRDFNDMNYVSWWPAGSKSLNLQELMETNNSQSDFRIRWRDLSMPAHQNPALRYDVASEEDDDFGLVDGSGELKEFVEKLRAVKGVDAKFKDVSESFAMAALANPEMLKSAEIPPHIYQPFLAQWRDDNMDMQEVAQRFAEVLRMAAELQNSKRMEHLIGNVTRQFAERELADINAFKDGKADQGRVFRINLEGLDVAAMQAEWEKISTDPDARYQLFAKNCSTVVARVLKAGGAENVLGHAWRPGYGIWKPNDLFQFGQALQKATQAERVKNKYRRLNSDGVGRILDQPDDLYEEILEKVAIENDGSPLRDSEPRNPLARFMNNELYGMRDDRRRIGKAVQIGLSRAIERKMAEKITLRGEAGRLEGYYHLSAVEPSDKVVLFIHGSGSSAEEQASKIQTHYQQQGVDMLAVSMRGYGTSDGRPSENGLYQDARTMFRYLVNNRGIKPENIVIHGYSMGAPIAADLARYVGRRGQPVAGLLFDRPMPSMTKAITAHNILNPTGVVSVLAKSVNGKFSVEKNLQGISKKTPIMVLTGRDGLGTEGEKLRTKLISTGYNISGEHTYLGHDSSRRMMELYANKIVTNLFESSLSESNLSASSLFETNVREQESAAIKGIRNDLKRYMQFLQSHTDKTGRVYDLRATKKFLSGYGHNQAEHLVESFHADMGIKQLVDLLLKGNWTAEQKGALSWEIENRALKLSLRPRIEKHSRLFRDVASTGAEDLQANEHLAPQLMLLNLSNDGFGGRCMPLSELVLLAKHLENDGQDNVSNDFLKKLYSAASVLSHPELYAESEKANASKLLGALSALYIRAPMFDNTFRAWKKKLSGNQALTVKDVIDEITVSNADGRAILLELNTSDHAMAAWSKDNSGTRMYGFYDPNVGIVEFSSAEKFSAYVKRFFSRSGMNMAQYYGMPKNEHQESFFNQVIVVDGRALASYRPVIDDKMNLRDILAMEIFDGSPMKNALGTERPLHNQNVASWEDITVTPQPESGSSRFDSQIIIQTENDPVVARAAANLAGKHPDSSIVVQFDSNGQYRVVYGDPARLTGKLRWQIIGHGREITELNHTRMGGYNAAELAINLKQFSRDFRYGGTPEHISLVGCSLISDDKRDGFARHFMTELKQQGIRASVSARSSNIAVDNTGRKYTRRDAQEQWVHKLHDNKTVLNWNANDELETRSERVRHGISESDIVLARIGSRNTSTAATGAIADNRETFHSSRKRLVQNNDDASRPSKNNQLSYSGNVQLQIGDGEFTSINWGTTNVGLKLGTGGFKSLAFGDNNVMVHLGDGDSKHSVNIAGYQALEGAQLFIGNRNISFNQGRSNDLIVMMDKSIPTPPMLNPFDGVSRMSGVLQDISGSFSSPGWLAAQEEQWTIASVKKYLQDMSGLDLTSSVDYRSLTEMGSQELRSGRGLKNDIESALNKKYNQWLGGEAPKVSNLSRADRFRQANEKLAFNFAVGGRGADIQVTTGSWNFMFGDNIQSLLDINLGSLFGLMTQQYTTTGLARTTFTYSVLDLPRQLKNKLLRSLARVDADTTLGEIFNVDYTAEGHIISRNGQPVDGVAVIQEMLEVISGFSSDQLKALIDPQTLKDYIKEHSAADTDALNSFLENHGLKTKAPVNDQPKQAEEQPGDNVQPERTAGFNSFNLPNLFATLFSQKKQQDMQNLVTSLKQNLTADLLNMQDKTFDFLRNSGHLQGDGDIHVSLGNYNFNWGGDGKDMGAYLGDNNNFWGGRGDDAFYSLGTSNVFTGGEGNDMGVLMGRENMMFGGAGDDVAVLAGRINYAYMGKGNDQVFAFGEGGVIEGGEGRDYIVASGNFNSIDSGEGQDYVVAIGNNNQVALAEGNDFATVFGNENRIEGNEGNDSIKLMGYHALINGGEGNDHLIADVVSKFSQLNGGDGDDLLVLGGYQNRFTGGTGVNSFVVSGDVIDNLVEDIKSSDKIIFNNLNWQNLWFQRSGYDLVLLTARHVTDTSAQGQFEATGSVTFNDYFNGNQADIITRIGDKDARGEREFTALSTHAVDSLVQAMSGFAPTVGDSGFMDSLDNQTKSAIVAAWSDTTIGKDRLI